MLILRMLSGLLIGAWRLVLPTGREKNRVANSFRPEPSVRIAMSGSRSAAVGDGDPYLHTADEMGKVAGRLCSTPGCPRPEVEAGHCYYCHRAPPEPDEKAAEFHSRAARKAVKDLDGEGVLDHMRNFRQYSSAPIKASPPFSIGPGRGMGTRCSGCGSTCARRDLNKATAACFACDPNHSRSRPSWTTADGRRTPVAEMTDGHLVNSAAMVRRWLTTGTRPVTDDRIRMCGHVLAECDGRGILHKVRSRHGR